MRIRILDARSLQHAGAEHPLSVGQVYDLPAGIATSLVREGAAEAVADDAPGPRRAPETKRGRA